MIRNKLSDQGQEVACHQTNLIREINKIDQKLGKIESKMEDNAKSALSLSKEVIKFEASEQVSFRTEMFFTLFNH